MRPQTLKLTRWAVCLFQEVQSHRFATIYGNEALVLGRWRPRRRAPTREAAAVAVAPAPPTPPGGGGGGGGGAGGAAPPLSAAWLPARSLVPPSAAGSSGPLPSHPPRGCWLQLGSGEGRSWKPSASGLFALLYLFSPPGKEEESAEKRKGKDGSGAGRCSGALRLRRSEAGGEILLTTNRLSPGISSYTKVHTGAAGSRGGRARQTLPGPAPRLH